jgi:hypothetical protein
MAAMRAAHVLKTLGLLLSSWKRVFQKLLRNECLGQGVTVAHGQTRFKMA